MPRRTEPTPLGLLPALRTHLWFASCPQALQMALIEHSRLVHLSPGEGLSARDEAHEGLSCVIAGALRMGTIDPLDGQPRLTVYAEPYNWFGDASLLDRLPRALSAVADTESTVLVVERQAIEAWLDANPLCWRDVARLTSSKLRTALTALEDASHLPMQQRLARRLLHAASNHGQSGVGSLRRRVRLPQNYLAQMLGVSRQTVNKALQQLVARGVLVLHYAEIEILDVAALLEAAGPIDPHALGLSGGLSSS
jgi:CRP-like cAMP-binding protein